MKKEKRHTKYSNRRAIHFGLKLIQQILDRFFSFFHAVLPRTAVPALGGQFVTNEEPVNGHDR